MATINDLTTSITELARPEAFALIRVIRQSRLTKKITKFTVKLKKSKATKKDPLANMDKQELLKLLKESLNG